MVSPDRIMEDVQAEIRDALLEHSRESSKGWKEWARSAAREKGASKAHKYCKADVRHEADTFWVTNASADERLKVVSAMWKAIWNEHSESLDEEPAGKALPLISTNDVLTAARAVSVSKATGVENWHACHLLQMSDKMVQRFADMLNIFEHGMPPPEDMVNSICLIPKPDGGLRPIGLTPLLFRIWGCIRAAFCRAFMLRVPFESVTGISWKTCVRAAYESQWRLEDSKLPCSCWTVPSSLNGANTGTCSSLLGSLVSRLGGVIAGCSIAMALATLYMMRIHDDFHKLQGRVFFTGM
eukprot:3899098-Amphidinium_carterae.4